MIKQVHVVTCDACCRIALARDEGNQRDSSWVAPADWETGRENPNVHFCPECSKKLFPKSQPNNPTYPIYQSREEY